MHLVHTADRLYIPSLKMESENVVYLRNNNEIHKRKFLFYFYNIKFIFNFISNI